MLPKYLVDVNLPNKFKLWNTEEFVYAKDIDERMNDSIIWRYARENNLIIVTKDTDFSNRMLSVTPPPKVIHIRFGNLKMKEFFEVMSKFWQQAVELIAVSKMIYIYKDRIESIQ